MSQRLSSRISFPFHVSARIVPPMGSASPLFCLPVPAYTRAPPRGGMAHSGAPWRQLPAVVRERGTRSIAARPTGATGASGHAGCPIGRPIRIGPPRSWTVRSCARTPARRARPGKKDGFRIPIPIWADRRGCPLYLRGPDGPRPDRTQARARVAAGTDAPRSCLRADRAYDVKALRA